MKMKPKAREAGVALVEFAIALPVLIALLVGLIEFGRYAYFAIEVGNAAHAGAQYGSLGLSNAGNSAAIKTAATNDGQNSISNLTVTSQDVCTCWNSSAGTANPSPPTAAQCAGGTTCGSGALVAYVSVTVTGTLKPLLNYSGLGLPSSWTVTRTALMPIAQVQ